MIRLFGQKRKAKAAAYRSNRWKGLRASQADEERQQVRRSRRMELGCRIASRAVIAAGIAGIGWGGTFAIREIGPLIQRGLEIREIQIEGVHHVTKDDVLNRLALRKGIALHQVSLSYLAERLRSVSWIKEATLERLPLHTLRITILERKPAAIVRVGSDHFLTDDEGVVLARLGAQDEPTLPLVVGADAKPLLQGDGRLQSTIRSAIELAKAMAHSVEGRVEIDVSNPLSFVASTRGLRFQFGEESVVEQWRRFQMVKAVFRSSAFDGKKREGGEVDLRYDNRVIVRERG
ncbi:MAG TPA: FtsQ-type POTRA domain-containing protein [Nitrospira sp.]|nr:FtsQ-type POTRA domain-containing protein [Nitrospira sp.]